MALLLGIDAGTTSVKAGLFSPDGRCLAVWREEYSLNTPAPDRAELDPQVYWQACARAVRQVLALSAADPEEIPALAVSSQGETTIPVDGRGSPLHPALVWLDNRAVQEASWLNDRFGEQAYDITGLPDITPNWTAAKILWLKKNLPEVFARAEKFILVQDYLIYRLTGRFVTDGSISCTTLFYDIVNDCWWEEMLEAIGIQPSRLAEISPPGSAVASLTVPAAVELGLSPQTRVVLGGMDQAAGAIGAGNIAPGIVSETTGAVLALQISVTRTDIDPNRRVPVNKHSIPGLYLCVPFCPTAGMAFKWFRDVFGESELEAARSQGKDVYDLLTGLAAQVPPGSDGLLMLPHLSGALSPVYNRDARGVFSGFTLSHHKGHFVRSILEAVAFMLRRNLELVTGSGVAVSEIRSSGGGARSPLWNQIKADVCGVPVISLASEEAALLGNAILAGVASGEFLSLEDGCRRMVALGSRANPGPDRLVYPAFYRRYCELDETLDAFFRRTANG